MDSSLLLRIWAQITTAKCQVPACMCAQALLYVWPAGERHRYELRTRDGVRFSGQADTDADAIRYGHLTLLEHGLERCRVVHGRPTEVPHA